MFRRLARPVPVRLIRFRLAARPRPLVRAGTAPIKQSGCANTWQTSALASRPQTPLAPFPTPHRSASLASRSAGAALSRIDFLCRSPNHLRSDPRSAAPTNMASVPPPLPPRPSVAASAKEQASRRRMAGFVHGAYYPSWKIYRGKPPSSMNYSVLTHVFYAFVRLQDDGAVCHLDEKADRQLKVDGAEGCLNAVKNLKRHNAELKVILSVGGGSGSKPFAVVAADVTKRRRFAQTLKQLIDQFEFDGADIDWEHPKDPEQGRSYVHLLATLREFLPAPQYVLSSALPAGEWCLRNIPLAEAAPLLDFVNLMAYDFAGSWTELSGHQAQLFSPPNPHNAFAKRSGNGAVDYLHSHGVPPSKIVLGVPVYGRSFTGVDAIGQQFTGHAGEQGIFEYKDLPRPGTQEFVDDAVVGASCVGGDDGFITYDNPQTVARKAEYVKSRGLGGLFYWTGISDSEGDRSLLNSGFNALHSGA